MPSSSSLRKFMYFNDDFEIVIHCNSVGSSEKSVSPHNFMVRARFSPETHSWKRMAAETVSAVPFSRPIAIMSAKEKPKIKFLKIDGFYTNRAAPFIYRFFNSFQVLVIQYFSMS